MLKTGARLLRSLAKADAVRHARACLAVVEQDRPNQLSAEQVLFFAHSHRFAGVNLDFMVEINPRFQQVIDIAERLPLRPDSLRDLALQGAVARTLQDVAFNGAREHAIAWLESVEGTCASRLVPTSEIWSALQDAPIQDRARLVATLVDLADVSDHDEIARGFGSLSDRVESIAIGLDDALEAGVSEAAEGIVVSVRLLVPEDDSMMHDQSVQVSRLILDLCPEADVAEVPRFHSCW